MKPKNNTQNRVPTHDVREQSNRQYTVLNEEPEQLNDKHHAAKSAPPGPGTPVSGSGSQRTPSPTSPEHQR